jgi:peptide/nickel transport system substrate-binding protein
MRSIVVARCCRVLAACAILCGASLVAHASSLTIALPGNVNTLDPDKTTTVGTDLSVISHLYTPLVDRGPDLALRPGLAKSWHALDETTWRFELTPGVTFPDGEPLDAAAVKWNIERVLDPKTAARNKPWFAAITEIRVVDPQTLDVVTKGAYPDLPAQMAMFFLMPPKWTAENNPSVAALGSGPYDLVRFTSGDRVELKAKPDYWGAKPAFDNVTFRVIPEDAARIAALLAGDVDLITVVPPSELDRINQSGRATAASIASTRAMYVKLNTLKPPFKDNPKLWQALNYAVDREAIVGSLWNGLGSLENCQVLSPAYFGYNPDLKPYAYDPARAKQLLAEAGFPNGLSFELEVPTGRYLQASDIAQVIAAQLADVGVTVKLHEIEFGSWMNKYLVARNLGDAAYMGLAWPTLDAGGLLAFWESRNAESYYQNADYDRLAAEAHATNDPARRQALYHQITEQFCAAPPLIFLFFQPVTYAERKTVNWQARGDDWVRAIDVLPR